MITNCPMFRGMSGITICSEHSRDVKNVSVKTRVFNGTDHSILAIMSNVVRIVESRTDSHLF